VARRSVNVFVSLGSAVTLAASAAGIAAADGYWPDGESESEAVAGVISDEAPAELVPAPTLGLSPLPPMELSPLDGPDLPPVQIAAPTGMVQAPAAAPAPPRPARRTKAS